MRQAVKIIWALLIIAAGVGCWLHFGAKSTRPVATLDNVALTLIDVLGDNDSIAPGTVTAPCLTAKDDKIPDQYEILKEKIRFQPGTTHYLNGVYVTLAPSSRRPLFQVRYPSPRYCGAFVEAYERCYRSSPRETAFDQAVLPAGNCIKEAAASLRVDEHWEGLLEEQEQKKKQR